MGFFASLCVLCNKPFMWFSGAPPVCADCLKETDE